MPFVFNPFTGTFDNVKDLSGYVPYSGATQNLSMGSFGIFAEFLNIKNGQTIIDTSGTITIKAGQKIIYDGA